MTTSIAITGATALVGPELELVEDARLVIDDGTIAAIGRASSTSAAADEVLEAPDLLLLPGFIDSHVHIGFVDPHLVLAGGVTTVRDLAWPRPLIYPVMRESRDPSFDGPRVLAAGPMLTAPGGYPTRAAWAPPGTGLELHGITEARRVVEELHRDGVSVIKVALEPTVGPTLDVATLRAIADAAHRVGLKVTAHIGWVEELEKAIAAGIDELAHMLMSRDEIPDRVLQTMVQANMVVVPTLAVFFGDDLPVAVDNLRRFRAAGGTVVYGTDLGNAGPRPGIDPREIDGLMATDFTTHDIVAAATVTAANHLGATGAGVLEPGADADVIGVPRRALQDPRALTEVALVFRGGRRVQPPSTRSERTDL
ncbi:MAG: amidohydrolase family protein [Actinomycetota bacterium]|nr:amidohydrolase family protein [Actinomycetota bacterium]